MTVTKWPTLYRYREELDQGGVTLRCDEYLVVAETAKCWWVVHDHYRGYIGIGQTWSEAAIKRVRRLVLKDQGGKRFCYLSRRDALHALLMRKNAQLRHTRMAMATAQLALTGAAAALLEAEVDGQPIACGHDDYTEQLNYSDM